VKQTRWILIDTETTGFNAPIYVVEIAAQTMQGWKAIGPPFRRLLNQNAVISPEASRVNGYTKEILERDGEPALAVYRDFAKYVGNLPIVAFNLEYDLKEVLLPEWSRLGISAIGTSGFCALRLAQRLLDPVPAGNCKLQTLRQYYRLPERGAHTALGDVETVADLFSEVLAPIAERLELKTWASVCNFSAAPWFPSRIAFGKFKGRLYKEALPDSELRRWLEWLAGSTNERSASMGKWYLAGLDGSNGTAQVHTQSVPTEAFESSHVTEQEGHDSHVVVYVNPELEDVKKFVAAARARLCDLEAEYTGEQHAVDVTQSILFGLLRAYYQKRDSLKLVFDYRRKYLDVLLGSGEEDAQQVADQYQEAKNNSEAEFDRIAAESSGRRALSEAEEKELKLIWKKLIRTFHPDRFANDPEKLAAFTRLTSEINKARDNGDIERLREIASDPHGFMMRYGLGNLDFEDTAELSSLRRLYETLQIRIIATIEALSLLRETPQYELHVLSVKRPSYLQEIATDHASALELEIEQLRVNATQLENEINELTGQSGL
jgi:DNA polymerase III epsilon subunit-like protein